MVDSKEKYKFDLGVKGSDTGHSKGFQGFKSDRAIIELQRSVLVKHDYFFLNGTY